MSSLPVILTKIDYSFTLPAGIDSSEQQVVKLIVQAGARVTIIEPNQLVATARIIDLEVQDGAEVLWSGYPSSGQLHETVRVSVGAHATFTRTFVALEKGQVTGSYTYLLVGQHACATIIECLRLEGQAAHAVTIEQLHQAPDTKSLVDLKVVLADDAILTYQGTITIEKNAVHAEAFQSQKNLVINPRAQVQSTPNLQVLTHEVQCGHGSAVSYVNDDHLFYLQARGLSHECAKNLLVEGFLKD